LSLLGQFLCFGNVRVLRFLVTSDEEENQQASDALKIDPVTWTAIDAQLADAIANRLYVSKVAQRETADADLNATFCFLVAQFAEATCKDFWTTIKR
jgi:hypothetical protein